MTELLFIAAFGCLTFISTSILRELSRKPDFFLQLNLQRTPLSAPSNPPLWTITNRTLQDTFRHTLTMVLMVILMGSVQIPAPLMSLSLLAVIGVLIVSTRLADWPLNFKGAFFYNFFFTAFTPWLFYGLNQLFVSGNFIPILPACACATIIFTFNFGMKLLYSPENTLPNRMPLSFHPAERFFNSQREIDYYLGILFLIAACTGVYLFICGFFNTTLILLMTLIQTVAMIVERQKSWIKRLARTILVLYTIQITQTFEPAQIRLAFNGSLTALIKSENLLLIQLLIFELFLFFSLRDRQQQKEALENAENAPISQPLPQ